MLKKQEKMMISEFPRKLRRSRNTFILLSCVLFITTLVFIGLYVDNVNTTKELYMEKYKTALNNASGIMEKASKDNFDFDTKYSEITAELAAARSYIFLYENDTQRSETINKLYYSFLKLKNQTRLNLNELSSLLKKIVEDDNNNNVYKQIQTIIDSLDKLDY